MFRIDRNNIEFTRGESVRFTIRLKGRELAEGTQAVFACKDTLWDPAAPCIEKAVDIVDGKAHVILTPYDTDITAGTYFWDLRVYETDITGETHVMTPMDAGTIIVKERVAE